MEEYLIVENGKSYGVFLFPNKISTTQRIQVMLGLVRREGFGHWEIDKLD